MQPGLWDQLLTSHFVDEIDQALIGNQEFRQAGIKLVATTYHMSERACRHESFATASSTYRYAFISCSMATNQAA